MLGLAQLCHGICTLRLPFKFFRRTVSQRRMRSLLTLVPVDKFLDVEEQVIEIAILVGVDFFSLQGFKKAFALRCRKDSPRGGLCAAIACSNVPSARPGARVRFSRQPTTLRENPCRITAKQTDPVFNRM